MVSGVISLTPGSELKIQAGAQVRALTLDQVAEIRFTPEDEAVERAWRFKEAGQTAKEYFGDPYPVRTLAATVSLADGGKISGHLYTTVLYVADGDTVQKVILPAKQRGQEGQTLKALVYPSLISFGTNAGSPSSSSSPASSVDRYQLKLDSAALPANSQVVAITRGALIRIEAKPNGKVGGWETPSPPGPGCFLAAQSGTRIIACWPNEADTNLAALIRAALTNSEDFFDDRRVLGTFADPTNSEIYSLVMASRKGKTTLDETQSQPWRLEIYRWKQDDDGRVMLAARNYFFRGILAKGEAPPEVELSEKLWRDF